MKRIACTDALLLLERGWDDGLGNSDVKTIACHLVSCPECAAAVAGWSHAETLLSDFSAASGRLRLPHSLAGRVHERLVRESARTDAADRAIVEQADFSRFLSRLQEDAPLRERIAESANRDTVAERLVALAAEHGMYFTVTAVQAALGKAQAANDGELSDEQLEAVAGGASRQLMWFQEWASRLPPPAG